MTTNIELPQWLDNYIFGKLSAKYCRTCSDMTVVDWDRTDILNYLGTYFPRSYAEAYCIFNELFSKYPQKWNNTDHLSVFDFGCGTGGEIIGMVSAIAENFPKLQTIDVKALDGNAYALRLLEKIAAESSLHISANIQIHVVPYKIDDFYDLSILDTVLNGSYDIFMSVKAICEFVTKDCFEKKNAYKYIVNFMLSKLNKNGIMFIEDVTTYNNVSQEWLPKMMDEGLANLGEHILLKNDGYNQTFTVSHFKRKADKSKVTWRIIQKPNNL